METRGLAPVTTSSTASTAIDVAAAVPSIAAELPVTRNSEPPRNSMPNTNPPRSAVNAIARMMTAAPMEYHTTRLPTKSKDRAPV